MSLDYVDLRPDLMVEMVCAPRPAKHLALQRLVEQSDHDGVHRQGLRLRMRHLRQLAHDLHPSHQASKARVPKSHELGRQHASDLPACAWADSARGRSAHGRPGSRRRGPRAPARGESAERDRVRVLRLAAASFLQDIDRSVRHWSMEFSPESHSQEVREAQEGEAGYTTEDMEAMIREAVRLRCSRIDIFFMIGLPAQTAQSVRETVEYCGHLFQLGDKRLSCFISPMGPFIDPGSRGFENPDGFGYRLFARTLEEHRQLLVQPTWERILNYETKWMTRRELVDATYDAAERLNELKIRHGRLSKRRGRGVARAIAEARALRARLDEQMAQESARRRMPHSSARSRASASRRYATSASYSGRGVYSISR